MINIIVYTVLTAFALFLSIISIILIQLFIIKILELYYDEVDITFENFKIKWTLIKYK